MKAGWIFAFGVVAAATSALAAAGPVVVVNGTGEVLGGIEIREFGGAWAPVGGGLSPGARSALPVSGQGCSYEVRATVAGKPVTWPGLNLCEVKVVTLNRRSDDMVWADYD